MSGNLPGTLPMASGGAHAIGPTDAAHGDGNVHAQAPAPEAAGPAATAAVAQVAGARSAGWPGFRRVATVLERDPASAERRVARAAEAADVVEVRLDAVWTSPPDPDAATDLLLRLRGATTRPLLATLRPRRQGGHFEGAEGARLGLLAAARLAGFDAIDVEDDNQDLGSLLRALRQDETPVVLSRHLAAPLPCRDDLLSLLLRQQDHGGALHKLAFDAGSYLDFLRALELAHTHAARGGKPCILPLGYGGAEGRALLSLAGNRAAYGHDGEGGVPGQPSLAAVEAVLAHWGLRHDELDAVAAAHPGWLAVLGDPVSHSLSPRMHNAALRAAGLPQRYGALHVPASPGALRLTLGVAHRIGLRGASITSPHKVAAASMVENDEVAAATGAVNCVRVDGERLLGTNTDATALRRIVAPHARSSPAAVVLGAGGAARAAVWALRQAGARVTVVARDPQKAAALPANRAVAWQDLPGLRADIWVQATPLGREDGDATPVDARGLRGARQAVELVYRPQAAGAATPFEAAAREAGIAVATGRDVLVAQAIDAFRFWFRQEAPAEVLRRAGAA